LLDTVHVKKLHSGFSWQCLWHSLADEAVFVATLLPEYSVFDSKHSA